MQTAVWDQTKGRIFMSKRHIFIAFALFLGACASSHEGATSAHVAIPPDPTLVNAPEEFHGAVVGRDTLRGQLPSEN
ncbi:MAG TPA: hypothetical protein VG841_05440 [Caulobacterales bacterium]|nr:hypothetical protein [Caulobacterales bacterium]